jgi:uncharacterized membrane protein
MSRLLSWAFVAVVGAYPLFVYFSLGHLSPLILAAVLLALAVLRLLFLRQAGGDPVLLLASVLVMALVAIHVLLSRDAEGLRYYPVAMNAAMLLLFAWSLGQPQSLIERFARLFEPDLPAEGVRYTRRVTAVWCLFFLINGSIALWTALAASWATWALYNGFIAYLLMATLFAGEYLVRRRVRQSLS